MQNIKDALLRDVDACREMLNLHDAMAACGYAENPYWDTFATIADGIYKLIGEHTETFDESITNLILTAPYLTTQRRVEMLMAEYRKNFPEQPRPITSEQDGKNRAGYEYGKITSDSYVDHAVMAAYIPECGPAFAES